MPNLLEETTGLVAFVRSVETGSFSSAARSLRTTPSAISRSVARLESKIGSRLFIRSTRALTLTPSGRMFFERVAPLLTDLDTAGDAIAPEISGRLKISLPSELGTILLKPILRKYAKMNRGVRLHIGMADRFVDLIREDYDVAVRVGNLQPSELIGRKLGEVRMTIVASPEFALEYGRPETLEQLAALPFARYISGDHPFKIPFENGAFITPNGILDCDSGLGIHQAALLGVGAAHLMECVVAEDIRAGRLINLASHLATTSLPITALHAFGRSVPRQVSSICDFISSELASLNPV